MQSHKLKIAASLICVLFISNSYAADESADNLHNLIKQQQKRLDILESQIEATASQVELNSSAANGHGTSTGKTSVGGYGEMHYNNLKGEGGASDLKEINIHRYIMFLGHEFTKKIRFWSELELEHSIAGEGKNGELELEQAYIEVDLNKNHKTRFGMMLVPVGIINETHEPPTFYGTERNPVEKNIVPATWWGGGVSLLGELAPGWSYDVAVHEGLNTTLSKSYKPRDGRQYTSKAQADNLAYTGRIKWTGVPGLELAATLHQQSNITQGNDTTAGAASLYQMHGIYATGAFTVKALYAAWALSGNGPKAIGADKQDGWYLEPSYKVSKKLGVFARFNQYDNSAGSAAGSTKKKQTDVGLNYWVDPSVVVKVDFQTQDNDDGKNQNGFNLGMGYMF